MRGGRWRLFVDTLLLGVVGALSAQLFLLLLRGTQHLFLEGIAGYRPPSIDPGGPLTPESIGPHGLWLVALAAVVGGLLSGLLVYWLAPEAEGHGTDTAVKAFHRTAGVLRARVAPLKMVASALTLGSGGSAGREGPTALIAAGVGSLYGSLLRRTAEEKRLLVLVGMASGLSAIFRSPIGTALFAVEVLYGEMEFEVGALLYTMLGSVVAYAVNGLLSGWEPLFHVPSLPVPGFADYGWYALLGVAAGVVAVALPELFYRTRDAFHAIPLPPHVKPALGGLGVGLIALALPQVLGGGYGWIQAAIDGRLAVRLLVVLVIAKMVAFALTIGSGGSGGVFAPSLFVGAMLGGALAPLSGQPSGAFAVVGMAAVFGGAARVPLATLLMVTEMTGGYALLVPAALAVTVSYALQATLSSRLTHYPSLYEAQVPSRVDSPAHHEEQLASFLRLVRQSQLEVPETVSHIELETLLQAGLTVELPGARRLVLRDVGEDSPWREHTVREVREAAPPADLEVIAALREDRFLGPDDDEPLAEGDRILAIQVDREPDGGERDAERSPRLEPT